MDTDTLTILFLSALLGYLAGAGTGGGSILMLWLTQGSILSYTDAKGINYFFFICASLPVILLKRKEIPWKVILPGVFAGILGTLFSRIIIGNISSDYTKGALAILMIYMGIRQLFYRRKAR